MKEILNSEIYRRNIFALILTITFLLLMDNRSIAQYRELSGFTEMNPGLFEALLAESEMGKDSKNSFVAIFKDTLLELSDKSASEIAFAMIENVDKITLFKDSIISVSSSKDTVWSFDTTFGGKRCFGTVFSGPVLTKVIKRSYSDNVFYFYSSSDIRNSRCLNGLIIYVSDEAGWHLDLKTED